MYKVSWYTVSYVDTGLTHPTSNQYPPTFCFCLFVYKFNLVFVLASKAHLRLTFFLFLMSVDIFADNLRIVSIYQGCECE